MTPAFFTNFPAERHIDTDRSPQFRKVLLLLQPFAGRTMTVRAGFLFIFYMYKPTIQKRSVLKFKHFSNHGYSLFAVLGKEVLIGVLSVATLQHATAKGISIEADKAETDSTASRNVMLQEVNVTGTRAPLTVSQQARMVTVLSREDIQAAPVQSVNDLLKYAAGVDVRQKGPLGALTDVSIRGGNSEQITVLLNGINICDAQTGHNAFDFPVDISEIERIEVLEGPAARVYGTSSLLGAINIVTRTPEKTSLSAHAEGGSYGYFGVGIRGNIASANRWNNQLSASYTRSDGYLRSKAGSLNADYRTAKAFYQGNYTDEDMAVRWHAGLSVKDFGANTFYSARYDDQFEHTFKTFAALQAENLHGRFHIRPSIYWNRSMDRFELFRDAPDKYPFNYHRTDIYGVNLNAYFDWTLGRTAVGAELRNEDLVSGNLGEPLSRPKHIHGTDRDYTVGLNRTNIQFILEHNIILERFTLSAGLIAVRNSQADMPMRVYPGIDASYRMGNWKLYASYNSSLRMPSVTELFYSVGGYKADKYLRPEELSALETGLKYDDKGITAKASLYWNHHRNLIDWISDGTKDANGALVWKSVNFGTINDFGVEASVDLNLHQLLPTQRFFRKIGVAYNFINQDKAEEKGNVSKYTLEYLKHKLVCTLQLNLWHSLDLGLNYRFQHRMGSYIDTNNERHDYRSYGIVDARMSWNAQKWAAYVEGNNLFGTHYVDYGNVPQPSVWVVTGISIHL